SRRHFLPGCFLSELTPLFPALSFAGGRAFLVAVVSALCEALLIARLAPFLITVFPGSFANFLEISGGERLDLLFLHNLVTALIKQRQLPPFPGSHLFFRDRLGVLV